MRAIIISRDEVRLVHNLKEPTEPQFIDYGDEERVEFLLQTRDYEKRLMAWEEAETPIKIHPDLLEIKKGDRVWFDGKRYRASFHSDVFWQLNWPTNKEYSYRTASLSKWRIGTEWEVSIKDNLVVEINPIKE